MILFPGQPHAFSQEDAEDTEDCSPARQKPNPDFPRMTRIFADKDRARSASVCIIRGGKHARFVQTEREYD